MSDKTFDLLLEDRTRAYQRIEQLEKLCRDMYSKFYRMTFAEYEFADRMKDLGLLEGEQ